MKINDMLPIHFEVLACHCKIQLPKKLETGRPNLADGQWFVFGAKTELTRKYRKACIEDLRSREMRGGSFPGDTGKCKIGGKTFIHYPKANVLCREDFVRWAEAHWSEYISPDGRIKTSSKPKKQEDVIPLPINRHALEVKVRAKELEMPTDIVEHETLADVYALKKELLKLGLELDNDKRRGKSFAATLIRATFLAAIIEHKERNYADAVSLFLDLAACALKAAEYEALEHSAPAENSKPNTKD